MISFADKINVYMAKSYLLVNTLDGEVQYSLSDNKQTYVEVYQKFLNEEEQKDLKTGLQSYERRMNELIQNK